MSITKSSYKSFLITLAICAAIITSFFAIYSYTKGSFFDGVLLTFIGISSMFFVLVLSVIIFKILYSILVNNAYRILGAILAFFLTIGFTVSIIISVFKLVTQELQL